MENTDEELKLMVAYFYNLLETISKMEAIENQINNESLSTQLFQKIDYGEYVDGYSVILSRIEEFLEEVNKKSPNTVQQALYCATSSLKEFIQLKIFVNCKLMKKANADFSEKFTLADYKKVITQIEEKRNEVVKNSTILENIVNDNVTQNITAEDNVEENSSKGKAIGYTPKIDASIEKT